jgi:8-oxo-dGTP diphosphatase
MNYVVGFLFRPSRNAVVTIRKTKPAWQKGKLNGVGGKIEDGETPDQAMVREFREETGAQIVTERWTRYLVMDGPGWRVFFFYAKGEDRVSTKTEEEVVHFWYGDRDSIREAVIPNLRWAIPMALDHMQNPQGPKHAHVSYSDHNE